MASGFEDGRPQDFGSHPPRTVKLKIGPAGRVVIPAEVRSAMKIKEGDVLLAHLAGDELRLATLDAAIRRSQTCVRESVPEGTSLVAEFLDDRRAMWAEDE